MKFGTRNVRSPEQDRIWVGRLQLQDIARLSERPTSPKDWNGVNSDF